LIVYDSLSGWGRVSIDYFFIKKVIDVINMSYQTLLQCWYNDLCKG